MVRSAVPRCLLVALVLSVARAAGAQSAAQPPAGTDEVYSDRREISNADKTQHHIGHVELVSKDTTIYCDDAWFYPDEDRFVATGHVTYSQGANRISADRADFNTKTRLGTFFGASGIATVQPQRPRPQPGALTLPPVAGQETVVYFFGDTVEKVGAKKYKITNGGFTTCVQPTARWELHADTVLLNLDHYTVLKQAIFSVKGVPMLYTPLMIYPTKNGDRATGFLIPTYGSSSLRGQSIHNAFFWAIDRSQDLTISDDWYSRLGQGIGEQYRYNYGPLGNGNLYAHFLDQKDTTFVDSSGNETPVPGSKSYELRGSANQLLPGNIHLLANVNYFSNVLTNQTFNTNVYNTSNNQRSFGVNAVGAWNGFTLNATADRQEYFYDLQDSVVSGDGPRIDLTRNERPLFGSQVYFGVTSEYVDLIRQTHSVDSNGVSTDTNVGVTRIDVWPQIRYPFKKWQWFTVNTVLSWRDTYYTRSAVIDPTTDQPRNDITADAAINRRYFSVQSQIVGPVFTRIWDTPDNGYAEKFKHSIEPYLTINETSSIDNFTEIIKTDAVDSIAGGTSLTYGVINRFFAKRKLAPGQPAQAREIVDVELSQTYYTNQLQSQYDLNYQTSQLGAGTPSHFSAYALAVRAIPTNDLSATVRAEFDPRYNVMRTFSANGTYNWVGHMQTSVGWSRTGCVQQNEPVGVDCSTVVSQFLNASANAHTADNRYGTIYNVNYDVTHGGAQQQSITGFYNAQCCGIAAQYQVFNYGLGLSQAIGLASDHRFFLSFTLAGLGNFSPFNGALSGVPR